MSKADIEAGRAYVTLFVKNLTTKPLQTAQKELAAFGAGIVGVGANVAGMGAAIAGGLVAAVAHFANVGSELNDLSARTGISTTALVELGYAAEQTGTDMETLEGGIAKMQKNLGGIGPESKKTLQALAAMGIECDNLSGLAPEDQFQAIAESIGSIQDPSQKAAAAMAIFGKSGTQLLPMMENLAALRKEARDLGIAPSPESIAAADAIGDSIDRVRKVLGAAVFEIGAAIAPMAQDVLDGFLLAVKAIKKFVTENKTLIITIAKVAVGLMVAGGAIVAIGSAFIAAGMAIGGVLAVFSAIGAVIGVVSAVIGAILSPIGLLIAALVAGAVAWVKFTESGRQAVSGLSSIVTTTFGGMFKTVTDTFGGIVDAIKGGDLELAGQIAMTGLRLIFAQGLEGINALFGETIGTIVGQLLSGDFSGAWATVGKVILGIWSQVTTGISIMMLDAMSGIQSGWAITARFFGDTWDAVMGGMGGVWSDFQNTIANGFINAISKFGGGGHEEVQAREDALRESLREEQAAQKQASTDRMAARKSESDAKLRQIQKDLQDSKDVLGENLNRTLDAAGMGVGGKPSGKPQQASAAVTALQEQLAALRAQAAAKVAEMNSGSVEKGGGSGVGDRTGLTGKASAASFSLAALAGSSNRTMQQLQEKQLSAAEKNAKEMEKQTEKLTNMDMHLTNYLGAMQV